GRLPPVARVLRPAAVIAALVDRAVLGRVQIALAAVVRDGPLFAARTGDLARAALLAADDFRRDGLVTLGDLGAAGDLPVVDVARELARCPTGGFEAALPALFRPLALTRAARPFGARIDSVAVAIDRRRAGCAARCLVVDRAVSVLEVTLGGDPLVI